MYYCIVNPSARSGRGSDLWYALEKRLKENGIQYDVEFTSGPGHATSVANNITSTSDSPVNLVVLGGDGTMNEVVSGITDFDNVLIGYLPVGSGNDFVRDLNYPDDPDAIIDRILAAQERRVLDLGKVTYNKIDHVRSASLDQTGEESGFPPARIDTRMFDVSAGIGFDAAVCEEALSSQTKGFLNKIGLGKLTYGAIAVRKIASRDKIPFTIEICNDHDGTRDELDLPNAMFVAAMIHQYEGGGFRFAPQADHSDGLFDLCIVGDISVARRFIAMPAAYFGRHYGFKGIYHRLANRVRIKTGSPIWVHTDGEVMIQSSDITFECLKQKLHMMT